MARRGLFSLVADRYTYSWRLLRRLVSTDFKLRYQGSLLGYAWSLLKPLMFFLVMFAVFGVFLRIGGDMSNYSVYLLFGMTLWNFFAEVTNVSVTSIVSQGSLIRKINFPRYVLVVSVMMSAFINLLLNLVVLVIFMAVYGADVRMESLWLIPLMAELAMISLGVAFFLSAAFVRVRDLSYIWELAVQVGFYITPVIYPISVVMGSHPVAGKIMLLNPVAQIIQDARYVLVNQESVTVGQAWGDEWVRLVPIAIAVVIAVASAWYFRKASPKFAELV